MGVVGSLSAMMSGYYPLLASADPLPTVTYIHVGLTY